MDDLWLLNASIPLKDRPLVELVRGAVLWCIWLARNKLCFQHTNIPTLQAVGSRIISLSTFWCQSLNDGSFQHLPLILPMNTNGLPCQDLIQVGVQQGNGFEDGVGAVPALLEQSITTLTLGFGSQDDWTV